MEKLKTNNISNETHKVQTNIIHGAQEAKRINLRNSRGNIFLIINGYGWFEGTCVESHWGRRCSNFKGFVFMTKSEHFIMQSSHKTHSKLTVG